MDRTCCCGCGQPPVLQHGGRWHCMPSAQSHLASLELVGDRPAEAWSLRWHIGARLGVGAP